MQLREKREVDFGVECQTAEDHTWPIQIYELINAELK
jgi:hypothetical protein